METILNKFNKFDFLSSTPLKDKNLSYNECLKMILEIGDQIELLNKSNKGLLFISKKDILENKNSYSLDPNITFYETENNEIFIDNPFEFKERLMAPELKEIDELPSKVSYSVAFYNLKNVAVECLGLKEFEDLNSTKLYYLLKRCSEDDPKYRIFFYI